MAYKIMSKHKLPKKIDAQNNLPALSVDKEREAFVDALVSYVVGIAEKFIPGLAFFTIWRQKRQDKKEAELLKALKNELAMQTQNVATISNLLRNPKGFVLFNRVMYIVRSVELEDENFDEISKLLARILIHISDKDFETLFSEISYAISRIEKLSPQALFLLSDSRTWPNVSVGGTTTSDVTLSGKWRSTVSATYLRDKGLDDKAMINRVAHSFGELESGGFAIVSKDKRVVLTDVGEEVYKFLFQ